MQNNILKLIFALTLSVFHSWGQQAIRVEGSVRDLTSGTALELVSVRLKHSSIGTVTNAGGKFVLHLVDLSSKDTLQISMLGYTTREIPLTQGGNSSDQVLTITLVPAATILDEVTIHDSLSIKAILRQVHRRIKLNYSVTPFQSSGFYREIQRADDTNVSLIEAAVLVQNPGYLKKSRDQIKLLQLRKSLGYENPYVPFWDNKNLLFHFLNQDFLKYRKTGLLKFEKAIRQRDQVIDGINVFVIDLLVKKGYWQNRLFIRSDNFAIIRLEENYDSSHNEPRRWNVESNPLVVAIPSLKKFQINYREYNGRYYPESHHMIFRAHYEDRTTGKLLLDFQITQTFVVTSISHSSHPINPDEALEESISLKKINNRYDPTFWTNYNILAETPLDSGVRADLEKAIPLQEQFEKR